MQCRLRCHLQQGNRLDYFDNFPKSQSMSKEGRHKYLLQGRVFLAKRNTKLYCLFWEQTSLLESVRKSKYGPSLWILCSKNHNLWHHYHHRSRCKIVQLASRSRFQSQQNSSELYFLLQQKVPAWSHRKILSNCLRMLNLTGIVTDYLRFWARYPIWRISHTACLDHFSSLLEPR